MSTALDIINGLLVRCQGITTAGGYDTDIGLSAEINAPNINPDEVDSKGKLVVFDTTEEPGEITTIHTSDYDVFLDLTVEAHIRIGSRNPVTLAHSMISDIKTAVMDATDLSVGGLVSWLQFAGRQTEYPNRDGDIVSVQLTFQTKHYETYGSP